jgi:hypothetical protein
VPALGLGLRQLTAVFPVTYPYDEKAMNELEARLGALGAREPSPYCRIPGLHGLRWLLLSPTDDGSVPVVTPSRGPLVLQIVFDGDDMDLLEALVEHTGDELRSLLVYCDYFPADRSEWAAFIQRHRVPGGYFFRDKDLTLTEIREALTVQREFTKRFAAGELDLRRDRVSGARELRDAFEEFRADMRKPTADGPGIEIGYPFPLSSRFERRLPLEERWVRRVVELTRRLQLREARETGTAPTRVAHTKHHGLVEARFKVKDDLDPRYRVGLFRPGKRFHALIRFSNTMTRPQADKKRDGRGMSIKLLEVPGEQVLRVRSPDNLPEGWQGVPTQDFVLLSHPCFFSSDIYDFTLLRGILDIGSPKEKAAKLIAYLMLEGRPREALILARTLKLRLNHPLEIEYHSATPYLFGRDLAVKYSVRLKSDSRPLYTTPPDRSDPNYLAKMLEDNLPQDSSSTIDLEFYIHLVPDCPDPKKLVEDATADWTKYPTREVHLADISIPCQRLPAKERMQLANQLVYSPWHSLVEHRPLGSVNRARFAIYTASAAGRTTAAAESVRPATTASPSETGAAPRPPPEIPPPSCGPAQS